MRKILVGKLRKSCTKSRRQDELEGETDVVGTSASGVSHLIRVAERTNLLRLMLVVTDLVDKSMR